MNKGSSLVKLHRNEEAIEISEKIRQEFNDKTSLEAQELVAVASINQAEALGNLNRNIEAIALCDEIINRFGNNPELKIQKTVNEANQLKEKLSKNPNP